MVGTGMPVELQAMLTESPSCTVTVPFRFVVVGASMNECSKQNLHTKEKKVVIYLSMQLHKIYVIEVLTSFLASKVINRHAREALFSMILINKQSILNCQVFASGRIDGKNCKTNFSAKTLHSLIPMPIGTGMGMRLKFCIL